MSWECWLRTPMAEGDHTKSIPNALKYGISVFSNQDVADKFIGVKVLYTRQKYKIGSFVVTALPVTHNVPCFAYMIEHEETGKIVFITDAVNFPYKIKGVTTLLIEANYDQNLILDHLCENQDIRSNNQYHMEINEAIKAIKRLYSSDLNTLVLCHLSDGQSDERAFQQRVFDEVGIYPHVANKHMVIELNKEEF